MLPDRLNLCKTKGQFKAQKQGIKSTQKQGFFDFFLFDIKGFMYNWGKVKR